MSDVLHGIAEDVPFDNEVADLLISTCNVAASAIEEQYGPRASWVSTAMAEFRGYFSQLFTDNASTAHADAAELADRLRETAQGAAQLKSEAQKEQQRRETARAWQQHENNRNVFEKGWDSVFGEDQPPVGPPASPVHVPISAPRSVPRQTPAPGQGGGSGGGTSSARPADLETFGSQSAAADDQLQGRLAAVKGALADFQSACRWGSLDASGVVSGFAAWLNANANDVAWARVVAAAFAAAGGQGDVSTLSNSALLATLAAHGVNAVRQDLTIAGPVAVGHPPTTGYAMDPVNTSTGNFVETERDMGFSGACSSLEFARTYNSVVQGRSLDVQTLGFGPGWSSWTDARLRLDDQQARMVLPDGRQIEFPRLGDGWDRATGESMWLQTDSEGGFVASDNTGTRWSFSRSGALVERSAGPGAGVRLTWEADRLVRMEHERGRWIEVDWSVAEQHGAGQVVVGLLASDGRRVEFGYDDRGRLVSASGPLGTRHYRWDDASGLLSAVVDADGVVEADNGYDSQGRVVRQRSRHGRDVRFVYLPGRVTVVSDQDGTRSNTWIADERGRLVGVVDADERRQSMAYDRHGNLVLVTERDGSTTVSEYDDRGRLVRTVSAAGTDVRRTWDHHDRLVTVAAAAELGEEPAVTRFDYAADEDRQPSLIVDPEGGRTELTWVDGLVTRVVDPTHVTVCFTHDGHGDLIAITDAEANAARLMRDEGGRVVAATTPSGATTHFTYDPETGLLAERTDPDGAVWRWEHTRAGRLTAVVDPAGGRTELEYSADGENTRTVDPLGRAVTRRFDDLGNLGSVELPDGSTWQFAHDALSRLRQVTDPAGGVSTFDYDAVGAVTSVASPDGALRRIDEDSTHRSARLVAGDFTTGLRLDRLGRVVASEGPDGSPVLTRYDRCGRPVEHVDADGGLTLIERDAAGRPVSVTRPGGGVVRYEYDVCGRPSAIVDELGARSVLAYNPDGRLVAQTEPTGDAATVEYDPCGRITRRREPGFGTSTWTYDLAGRVVVSRDPQFGRRRFCYDSAGQLVQAVDGNGGITRWEYDANGRAVVTTDPSGGVTRREFDAMNRVVAETDLVGRVTRAGYDADGRQRWQTSPDGQRTEWTYDADGRVASVVVDGRVVSSIVRDLRARRVWIYDSTDPSRTVVHELAWDGRGNLVSRTRDGRGLRWTYDADGRRASRTGPDGQSTRYRRDAAGRLVAVENSLLGSAEFTRDAAGRVISAVAGDLRQDWTFHDGFATSHRAGKPGETAETLVDRDELGRILSLHRDGVHTSFGYDEACQLVEARTAQSTGTSVRRWRYDAAGRLVAESRDGATRELSYDAAGQLTSIREMDGSTLTYTYDGQGRRTSSTGSDGGRRDYSWTDTGWLGSVVDTDRSAERRVTTIVDALGELARIGTAEVFLDSADTYARSVAQVGGEQVVVTGLVTGIGESWEAPGWRGVRAEPGTTRDPWGSVATGIGPAGELRFAGLEWLGARVYDPSTRGFLSVDPLDPVVGAGWSGNRYAFAGNDPLHQADPTGLRPATDADLKAYAEAHQGAIHAAGQWLENNWEYVAGGAMVIAGGVLIATGVGGPAGMMLISAGADTIIQKATTGKVNWGEVAISGAMGAWGGEGAALRLGAKTALQRAVVGGVISGAANGAVGSEYAYWSGPGPHSISAAMQAGAEGTVLGGVSGGAVGAAGHGLESVALRRLADAHVIPGAGEAASDTNKIYSAQVLQRMGEDPGPMHNFPGTFDDEVFANGTRTVSPDYFNKLKPNLGNDSIQYRLEGSVNGKSGSYEIFTRPSLSGRTELITHRLFRPDY